MVIKDIAIDISNDIISNAEEITSFSVFLLMTSSFDWKSELLRYSFNIGSAIVSGYIVHKLKGKIWDKKTKRNGKKNKNS